MKHSIIAKINDINIIISAEIIQEVIIYEDITYLPNVSKKILGIVNYNGMPIPVFNTAEFFETEFDINDNYRLIVFNIDKENIAFVFNSVDRMSIENELNNEFENAVLLDINTIKNKLNTIFEL